MNVLHFIASCIYEIAMYGHVILAVLLNHFLYEMFLKIVSNIHHHNLNPFVMNLIGFDPESYNIVEGKI